MLKKLVVFGGSGFIGTHLLARLSDQTQFEIVSVDIRAPKKVVPGVRYVLADVRNLSDYREHGPVERIYNLAAVHTTPGHPEHEYYETNVSGATEVCAFARRSGCDNIVFTSSISVYGPGEDPKTELSTPAAVSAYGRSKLLAEQIHRSWREGSGERKLIIVRPAVIFGHGEGGNFVRLAAMLKRGGFLFPGRKDTIKACFYVHDLIDAIDFAVSSNESYTLLNAAYPDRYTLEQIVEALIRLHFPKAKTFSIPYFVLRSAAFVLKPLGPATGIHPERITKLVKSTDVYPQWLLDHGQAKTGRLEAVLADWRSVSEGLFN